MEEVDSIIIHSLKQIGCDIDESISHLGSFDTELVIRAVVSCFDVIKPGLSLSHTLPENIASRFRMAAALAQLCLDLGYRGEIGYQTFLYSTEADLRRVLMFLIEKLPKETEKGMIEPLTKTALLEKSIASAISKDLVAPWLPHYCYKKRQKYGCQIRKPYISSNICSIVKNETEAYEVYVNCYRPSIINQVSGHNLIPSIISLNSKKINDSNSCILEKIDWINAQKANTDSLLINNSLDTKSNSGMLQSHSKTDDSLQIHKTNQNEEMSSEETTNISPRKQNKIEIMKYECEKLQLSLKEVENLIKQTSHKFNNLKNTCNNEKKELDLFEAQKSIKVRAYELLDKGEENVKKLKEMIQSTTDKLIYLANQWEDHRFPLISKYREERTKSSSKMSAYQKILKDLKALKEKEQHLMEENKNKDQQYLQLIEDVEKLPNEINRTAYTQRILEIISNVRRQTEEIHKVLVDTRKIQKDINILSGRLERSFTMVDELIFRDARTNEACRKAYKLLALLHSDCSELVTLVEETGATVREVRDLEEQIDIETTKNVGANLERITADMKQMRQETAILTAQLQNKTS